MNHFEGVWSWKVLYRLKMWPDGWSSSTMDVFTQVHCNPANSYQAVSLKQKPKMSTSWWHQVKGQRITQVSRLHLWSKTVCMGFNGSPSYSVSDTSVWTKVVGWRDQKQSNDSVSIMFWSNSWICEDLWDPHLKLISQSQVQEKHRCWCSLFRLFYKDMTPWFLDYFCLFLSLYT